jgi:predicted DNA-binding transcriptional regulator AlpA
MQMTTAARKAARRKAGRTIAKRAQERREAPPDGEYLTPHQLGRLLGKSTGSLAVWRTEKGAGGPPFIRVGSLVRYSRRAVEQWLQSRTTVPRKNAA